MKDTELVVYREYFGRFEEVGRVAPAGGGIGFAYSESYLQSRTAQSISQALPLRSGAFPARETESFFNGILPEGSMRRSLGRAFHADIDDVRMEDVVATARSCGVGARYARDELEELIEAFPAALRGAAVAVAEEGFPQAADVGGRIEEGFLGRRDSLR